MLPLSLSPSLRTFSLFHRLKITCSQEANDETNVNRCIMSDSESMILSVVTDSKKTYARRRLIYTEHRQKKKTEKEKDERKKKRR